MPDEIKIGAVIEVGHPFVRGIYEHHEGDGEGWVKIEKPTWSPGIRMDQYAQDDYEAVADAMGTQVLTVVSLHKPGRFPERVFYTRHWRDPNGHEFGKGKLRIKTVQAFRVLIRGYRHEFKLLEPLNELSAA